MKQRAHLPVIEHARHYDAQYRRRLATAFALSLLAHAFVMSLQFGLPGLGLPGLELPWNQRRAQADGLRVVLANPSRIPETASVLADGTGTPERIEPPQRRALAVPAHVQPASPDAQGKTSAAITSAMHARTENPARAPARPRKPGMVASGPRLLTQDDMGQNTFSVPLPIFDGPDRAVASHPDALPEPAPPDAAALAASPVHEQMDARAEQEAEQHAREAQARVQEQEERRQAEAQAMLELQRREEEERARRVLEREAQRQDEERAARQAQEAAQQQAAQQRRQEEENAHRAQAMEARMREDLRLQEEEQRAAMEREERRQALEAALRQKQAEELAARERAREEARRQEQAAAARREQALAEKESAAQMAAVARNAPGDSLAARALEQARKSGEAQDMPPLPRQLTPPVPDPAPQATDPARRRSALGRADHDVGVMMYVESWRLKIERNGRLNYRQSLVESAYTEPVVTVAVRSDGSVEDIVFHRSSGRPELDEAVRRIVRLNARYAAFPPELARRFDVIEIRRTWNFDDKLRLLDQAR